MATMRAAGSSATSIFRFASQPVSTRRCAHCLKAQRCLFSSSRPVRQSSKRPLMTDSAYRPQTLDPAVPPRNEGVPDTSITTAQQQTSWPPKQPWERHTISTNVSETEGEAQQSRATVTDPQPSPSKPRKSKLRPRKAPITLTNKAVSQLRELFEQPEGKMIRVGVKNRGCSGLAYHLEYVDKPGAFDETVEQDGVKVLIDSKALFSIIGSEMDWLEDKLSARFIFKNPNITEQCGCGESFSIS